MYKIIITGDGSSSLYNEDLQEGYHSRTGAFTESVEKFAKPLAPLFTKKKLRVLDTCFGLAYRSCALAYVFADKEFDMVGVEIDASLFDVMKKMTVPKEVERTYSVFQSLSKENSQVQGKNFTCKVITNDITKVISSLREFDVIMHDPFSPRKVPQLWSETFLSQLISHLASGGILVTYSSAGAVRNVLRKNGLKVINGPSIGRRAPSTIAVKES